MRKSGKCEKCGSTDIIPKASMVTYDRGTHDLRIRVDAHPGALIFKQTEYSDFDASVCGECGYVEFYVRDPRLLYQAYRQSLEEGQKG